MSSELFILIAKTESKMAKKREKCCQVWQRTERANFSVFRTFRNILAFYSYRETRIENSEKTRKVVRQA